MAPVFSDNDGQFPSFRRYISSNSSLAPVWLCLLIVLRACSPTQVILWQFFTFLLFSFSISNNKFLFLFPEIGIKCYLFLHFKCCNPHCTKNEVFHYGFVQFPADLVKFTEEIRNRKLHFLCNAVSCAFAID